MNPLISLLQQLMDWLKNHRTLSFLLLAPLPLIIMIFILITKSAEIADLELAVITQHKRAMKWEKEQIEKKNKLKTMSRADPLFLEAEVETINLLFNPSEKYVSLAENPEPALQSKAMKQDRQWKKKLHFERESVKVTSEIQESIEKQSDVVEVNEEGLMKVLCKLEGVEIGPFVPPSNRPDLIIRTFDLKKIATPSGKELYELKMDLIKREIKNSSLSP